MKRLTRFRYFTPIMALYLEVMAGLVAMIFMLTNLLVTSSSHVPAWVFMVVLVTTVFNVVAMVSLDNVESKLKAAQRHITELEAQLTPTAPAPQRADETEPQADH